MEDWTEVQIERLQQWISKQMEVINSELAARCDGEPTGVFDKDGRPGKMVHPDIEEICLSLAKERIETKLRNVGISCIVSLTVTSIPLNPRLPGHSKARVEFCVGGEVPYMFR
jgi:hypothetical protein